MIKLISFKNVMEGELFPDAVLAIGKSIKHLSDKAIGWYISIRLPLRNNKIAFFVYCYGTHMVHNYGIRDRHASR